MNIFGPKRAFNFLPKKDLPQVADNLDLEEEVKKPVKQMSIGKAPLPTPYFQRYTKTEVLPSSNYPSNYSMGNVRTRSTQAAKKKRYKDTPSPKSLTTGRPSLPTVPPALSASARSAHQDLKQNHYPKGKSSVSFRQNPQSNVLDVDISFALELALQATCGSTGLDKYMVIADNDSRTASSYKYNVIF